MSEGSPDNACAYAALIRYCIRAWGNSLGLEDSPGAAFFHLRTQFHMCSLASIRQDNPFFLRMTPNDTNMFLPACFSYRLCVTTVSLFVRENSAALSHPW